MNWRKLIAGIVGSLVWPAAAIAVIFLITRFLLDVAMLSTAAPSESIKNIAETVAFACAALYFLYRATAGYLIANISITASASRQIAHSGNDYLIVRVTVSKGDRGSVNLHDAQIQVDWGSKPVRVPLKGIRRLSFKPRRDAPGKEINWDLLSESSPMIRLTPGEETVLSGACTVPTSALCNVEVVVLGQMLLTHRFGQWQASTVSLPREIGDAMTKPAVKESLHD